MLPPQETLGFQCNLKGYVNANSYGSGITLWMKTENSVIGSDSLGEGGKRAELVGQEVANNLLRD